MRLFLGIAGGGAQVVCARGWAVAPSHCLCRCLLQEGHGKVAQSDGVLVA